MSPDQLALRPVSRTPLSCKVCDGKAELYGVVDFHRPCHIPNGYRPPLLGVPVYYSRCGTCGFLFTDAFDDWSEDQFKAHIYNDDYLAFDPDYKVTRPRGNGQMIAQHWQQQKSGMRVLDFGGGNDVLCSTLRDSGFPVAVTYDPMVPEHAGRPEGKFDLITCFETLEHLPDPVGGIARMVECAADPGVILYSTLTQPADLDNQGLGWWYVGPRNGHISMFTKQSLASIWARHGFKHASLNDGMHIAYRTMPEGWRLG